MAAIPTRIAATHFKNLSFGERGFVLGNLNLLIGPNGCGKSNLVSLLRFLKEALTGEKKGGGETSAFESALYSCLGAPRILTGTLEPPGVVRIVYHFESVDIPDGLCFELSLKIEGKPSQVYAGEEILRNLRFSRGNTEPFNYFLCRNHQPDTADIFCYEQGGKTGRTHGVKGFSGNKLGLREAADLLENSEVPPDRIPLIRARRLLIDTVSQWLFYNANAMNLEAIRQSESKVGFSDTVLSPSGENLPIVMYNLCQESLDFEERITECCRAILPDTRRVRAVHMGRYNLSIEWYMRGMDRPFYLSDLSDGTVRMLCWAVILKSPKPGSLIVIDEPEMGLHVSWMPILAKWIKEAATATTRVVVITHSSDLLDHFTDQVELVHCFNYEPDGLFSVSPLSREILAQRVDKEGWQLGDLYRVGDPDVGGWPW